MFKDIFRGVDKRAFFSDVPLLKDSILRVIKISHLSPKDYKYIDFATCNFLSLSQSDGMICHCGKSETIS